MTTWKLYMPGAKIHTPTSPLLLLTWHFLFPFHFIFSSYPMVPSSFRFFFSLLFCIPLSNSSPHVLLSIYTSYLFFLSSSSFIFFLPFFPSYLSFWPPLLPLLLTFLTTSPRTLFFFCLLTLLPPFPSSFPSFPFNPTSHPSFPSSDEFLGDIWQHLWCNSLIIISNSG